MREIIDFHMHPWVRCEDKISNYPELLGEGDSAATIKADLTRCGITQCAGSLVRLDLKGSEGGAAILRRGNDEMLALRDRLGDFYIPGMMIHPAFVRESCEELERMHAAGVRLIGELVPYMQGWEGAYSAEGLDEILDLAGSLSMVVSFHSMAMDTAYTMVKRHPGVTFVAAHPGEKPAYLDHLAWMEEFPNYYLDLSGTGLFRYGMLAHGVRAVGAERFLFGSDYPICSPGMNIGAVDYEKITDADRELIFAGNAKRILNL